MSRDESTAAQDRVLLLEWWHWWQRWALRNFNDESGNPDYVGSVAYADRMVGA